MVRSGQTIIPVFYNVDVNDIRWIKGKYAQEFSKLEARNRYRPEKLDEWKSALQNVSYLKGHIVNSDDDEGMLKTIENFVRKCSKKTPFVVAKHPVGLDEIIQDFKRSVLESFENVKIVGITGMGGCGKTTLAKEYYNEKMQSFYRCCFVGIDQDVPIKKLYEKQRKMFQDLGGSKDILFDNVEEGKAILAERLRFVQVFIILDGVGHLDQLECLLPIKDNFRQGSVIVITTRDSHILTSWGIPSNSIYKMKGLNFKHAMELFCLHAFKQPSPKNGFECLVTGFLKFCQGLPLSLKVLGGLVNGKSKSYWDSQLDKVSKSLPKDIKSVLKVSFDALDEKEEEIFLDISCFFIGTEKDLAIAVWDESKWSGECSLETLVDKYLVEVDETNCLRMHDLLRDLGKDISKTRSPYRLWSPEQITHIFEKEQKGSVLIRGIKAQTDEFYEELVELVKRSGRSLKHKKGLKILDVENNNFTEELATLSEGLVCLRRANFPHMSLPSGILLKKLRVLELCEASKLEEPWSEIADPPLQLRVLKIIHARNLMRFPRSIGFLKHLKEISFDSEGAPIEGLPKEFCHLQSLECLRLIGCDKLKSLPSKFGNLTNLQNLHLSGCSGLMIPSESLVQLTSLQVLNIERCPGVTELVIQPDCFSSSLCSLELLVLSHCNVSRVSISPQCCPSLQYLCLSGNQDLVEIDSLPTSVKNVDVSRCSNLQSISLNCCLVNLQHLHMWECERLKEVQGLENCSSLEMLMVHTWGELPVIQGLRNMESLKRVSLTTACPKSAFEACLQTLNKEKLPRECIICCRIQPGMEAIVKSLTLAGLTLVDSFDRYSWHYMDNYSWQYVFLGERSANAAAMICLVINSPLDDITLLQVACVKPINFDTQLKQGKWVYVGVFTPSSLEGREVTFALTRLSRKLEDLAEMGILVMGEENRVVDAFHELVQRLKNVDGIYEAQ